MYFLPVLENRSLKLRCLGDCDSSEHSTGVSFLLFSRSWWLWLFLGLWLYTSNLYPHYIRGLNPLGNCVLFQIYAVSLHLLIFYWVFCIYIPERYLSVIFLLGNFFAAYFCTRIMLASWNELESSLCFYFLKRDIENWYHFLLKCLLKFISDSIWAQCFIF